MTFDYYKFTGTLTARDIETGEEKQLKNGEGIFIAPIEVNKGSGFEPKGFTKTTKADFDKEMKAAEAFQEAAKTNSGNKK